MNRERGINMFDDFFYKNAFNFEGSLPKHIIAFLFFVFELIALLI